MFPRKSGRFISRLSNFLRLEIERKKIQKNRKCPEMSGIQRGSKMYLKLKARENMQ
jgi:hypothetical protein